MKPYPDLSDNALMILERRYLLRNEQGGVIETQEMMFKLVSKNFASANVLHNDGRDTETEVKEFFDMLSGPFFCETCGYLASGKKCLKTLQSNMIARKIYLYGK